MSSISTAQITIAQLYEQQRETLSLEVLTKGLESRVPITISDINRPGMALMGYPENFLFERIQFLEKLAALIPRPAVNLLLYHGVLAPRARWRSQVVRYGRPGGHGRIDRLPLLVDFAPLVASVITPCPIPDGCDHNPHIVVIAGVGK